MAFNTSALSTWVKPGELFGKALYKSNLSKIVDIIPGIKGYMDLHPFSTSTVFQAGACSYNATNSTVVGSVRLTVDQVSTMETFCVSDFNTFALGNMLKPGSSDQNDEAFVGMFAEEKLQSATNALWTMAVQGNKVSGSGNNALTNGYLYNLIHTAASASTISATSAVTASNAIDIVDYMISVAPTALLQMPNITVQMTTANYLKYIQNCKSTNNYHFTGTFGDFETTHPGFPKLKVMGIPELDSNADGIDMVLTYDKNIVFGTDEESEISYDLWYSKDDRNIKSALEVKVGATVREPAMVVIIK